MKPTYQKTIIVILSKQSQLEMVNLQSIPQSIRNKANLVLVINQNLSNNISNEIKSLYNQIIYVKVNHINDIEV